MRSPTLGRRRVRSTAVLSVLFVLGSIVAACGSAASAPQAPVAGAPSYGGPIGNGGVGAGVGQGQGGDVTGLPAASAAPGVGGGGDGQVAIVDEAKIVRTGSLQLTVDDVPKALTAARDAIGGLGGYIGASQQQRDNDQVVASVTYRIPVARWEDALSALRALGTEIGEQTGSTEVTGQIVDLDARIRNLKASETALVGYAQNAPKVSDLLEIESRLTDTRGEIERLTAQQAQLQDQSAMATLTVTFGTEVVEVTQAAQRWDPAAEVDRASATLLSMGQAVVSFVIVFAIVWLPLILFVLAIAGIAWFVARRLGWGRSGPMPPVPPVTSPPAASAEG